MQIKIIETETGEILTKADTRNMRLPFETGWPAYGIFNAQGECVDVYPRYSQAAAELTRLSSYIPLAA